MKAIAAIGQRPLLGWGEAQFNHLIQPDIYAHPHNVILQILLAWGIVGLSLILATAFLFLRWLRPWIDEARAPYLFPPPT
jgi:O-antigen ligase